MNVEFTSFKLINYLKNFLRKNKIYQKILSKINLNRISILSLKEKKMLNQNKGPVLSYFTAVETKLNGLTAVEKEALKQKVAQYEAQHEEDSWDSDDLLNDSYSEEDIPVLEQRYDVLRHVNSFTAAEFAKFLAESNNPPPLPTKAAMPKKDAV